MRFIPASGQRDGSAAIVRVGSSPKIVDRRGAFEARYRNNQFRHKFIILRLATESGENGRMPRTEILGQK